VGGTNFGQVFAPHCVAMLGKRLVTMMKAVPPTVPTWSQVDALVEKEKKSVAQSSVGPDIAAPFAVTHSLKKFVILMATALLHVQILQTEVALAKRGKLNVVVMDFHGQDIVLLYVVTTAPRRHVMILMASHLFVLCTPKVDVLARKTSSNVGHLTATLVCMR